MRQFQSIFGFSRAKITQRLERLIASFENKVHNDS